MELHEVKNLIRMGFENPSYFKRSTWRKVERIMKYLSNKGYIKEVKGYIKYKTLYSTKPIEADVQKWAELYMKSPFIEHMEEYKRLAKKMGLPLNDMRVLKEFMNTKN